MGSRASRLPKLFLIGGFCGQDARNPGFLPPQHDFLLLRIAAEDGCNMADTLHQLAFSALAKFSDHGVTTVTVDSTDPNLDQFMKGQRGIDFFTNVISQAIGPNHDHGFKSMAKGA